MSLVRITFFRPAARGVFQARSARGPSGALIATVEVSAEAAAKLAPHVDRIARAEGFPVHGESAMIRAKG